MNYLTRALAVTALLSASVSAYALKGDTNKPINIESGSQSVNMETNTLVFDDNVVITQGSIKINASKVKIIRQVGKRETVEAYGSPVKFRQTLDNGKPVNGQGNSVHYNLGSEFLTLTGNAQLKQQDSFVKANKITYDVKKQQLKATKGKTRSRVKTVLIPTQLKQK